MQVSEKAVRYLIESHAEGVTRDEEVSLILTRWVLYGDRLEDFLERITREMRTAWQEYARCLPECVEHYHELNAPRYTSEHQPQLDLLRAWAAKD